MERADITTLLSLVKAILYGWWRFRWMSIGVAWLICVAGWVFTLSMPDIYEAHTRVYVDTKNALRPLLKGMTVNTDVYSDIDVMSQVILSAPSLEKIIDKTLLYSKNGAEPPMEEAIARLRSNVYFNLDRKDNLTITFQHKDPKVALWVLETLLDAFIEGTLGTNREDTDSAQEFIEKKIIEYESKLSDAEDRLADFKRNNIGMLPGDEGDYYRRLQNEMDHLSGLESEVRLAEQRRDEITRQMQGETPVFGMLGANQTGGRPSPYDAQIADFERQLTQLRLNYTESHPDVIRIKELISNLRALKVKEAGSMVEPGIPQDRSLDLNPVYQQMKMVLSSTEVELSQLRSRQASQRRLVQELRQKVDTIPKIEAELTRLNRNYQANKAQYEQLVKRLEQAKLSEDADTSENHLQFRVIDPPSVQSDPVSPDRALLMTFSLLLAVIGGFGTGILRNLSKPVFYSSAELEKAYDIPVLGAISQYPNAAETAVMRISAALFAGSVLVLFVVYALLLAFSDASLQMVGQVSQIFG